jgi:hypothetical protein
MNYEKEEFFMKKIMFGLILIGLSVCLQAGENKRSHLEEFSRHRTVYDYYDAGYDAEGVDLADMARACLKTPNAKRRIKLAFYYAHERLKNERRENEIYRVREY